MILLTLLLWAADRQMRAGLVSGSQEVDQAAIEASLAPEKVEPLTQEEEQAIQSSLEVPVRARLTDEERAKIEQSLR